MGEVGGLRACFLQPQTAHGGSPTRWGPTHTPPHTHPIPTPPRPTPPLCRSAFNYESVWGQRALREMYSAVMQERQPSVVPGLCKPGRGGGVGGGGVQGWLAGLAGWIAASCQQEGAAVPQEAPLLDPDARQGAASLEERSACIVRALHTLAPTRRRHPTLAGWRTTTTTTPGSQVLRASPPP